MNNRTAALRLWAMLETLGWDDSDAVTIRKAIKSLTGCTRWKDASAKVLADYRRQVELIKEVNHVQKD